MAAGKTPRWLEELADEVRCSPSFIRTMNAQLAVQFRAKTELDVAAFVLTASGEGWVVQRNGLVGFVKGTIVGSRLGFPVTIAWADPKQHRSIEPHDQVTDDDAHFWWHKLPADEIVAEEASWPEPPFDITRFPFPIDYRLKIWPHVRFTLGLREPVTDQARDRLNDLLRPVFEDWKRDGKQGTFHDIGVVERVDDRTVAVDIDLGSTGPAGMEYVLDQLASTGLVASVTLRAY